MANLDQFLGGGGGNILPVDFNDFERTRTSTTQKTEYTPINLPNLNYNSNISNRTLFTMSGKFIIYLSSITLRAGLDFTGSSKTMSATLKINIDGSEIFNKTDSVTTTSSRYNSPIISLDPGTPNDYSIPILVENSFSVVGSISCPGDNSVVRSAILGGQIIPLR